jgi:hypothetical protein
VGNIKRTKDRPEAAIQEALVEFLTVRGWRCDETHGSVYQTGFPDIYIAHPKWGKRWIDCKVAGKYSFTNAQKVKWPEWEKAGTGIWILTAATYEEYRKLWQPPNWRQFWKPSWGELQDIDKLLDQLIKEQDSTYRDC